VNAIGFSCVGDWIDFATGVDKRAERDADEFAGRLLVPTEKLISDISEMREEIAGMENAALAVGIDDVPSIYQWKINAISSALAPRYGVAETTIEIRINRERIRI
jgi:phenylpyruvate tautomerase PptA (4-oxalocrotonate tautomerase family)